MQFPIQRTVINLECHSVGVITTPPPVATLATALFQFLLRIHKSSLNPISISPITPDTFTVEQGCQGALDLLVYILQLDLIFLDLTQETLGNDCRQRRSSSLQYGSLGLRELYAAASMMVSGMFGRRR